MQTAFARQTSLKNIVGRSDYIKDPTRQEKIVMYSNEHMISDWQEYADYENNNKKSNVANNQGREIIIALPNELDEDHEKLKEIIDDYSKNTLGNNREFEYAVHWNKDRTNLHAHIIYSERERKTERVAKTYKRDYWYDIETNRIAKAKSEGSELRYKKGQVQKDKKGNVKYENQLFNVKDKRFIERKFNYEIKDNLRDTLNKFGFNFRVFNQDIELPQAKLFKGASDDYIKMATESNKVRAEYNKNIVKAVDREIVPRRQAIVVKYEIINKVKKENSKTKSISIKGINYIKKRLNELTAFLKIKLNEILNINVEKEIKELTIEIENAIYISGSFKEFKNNLLKGGFEYQAGKYKNISNYLNIETGNIIEQKGDNHATTIDKKIRAGRMERKERKELEILEQRQREEKAEIERIQKAKDDLSSILDEKVIAILNENLKDIDRVWELFAEESNEFILNNKNFDAFEFKEKFNIYEKNNGSLEFTYKNYLDYFEKTNKELQYQFDKQLKIPKKKVIKKTRSL